MTTKTFDGLPEMCWVILESANELVIIKRGENGYYPQRADVMPYPPENKDYLNERLGVTKAQEQAMKAGSMFGWDIPASNPANYDEEGNFKKQVFQEEENDGES